VQRDSRIIDDPEVLLHEFLNMKYLKISTIRFDVTSEFGKSSSVISYCKGHGIVLEAVSGYTHDQNAIAVTPPLCLLA
jgi:hypothetical protein